MKKALFVVGMMLLAGCSTISTEGMYGGVCFDAEYAPETRFADSSLTEQDRITELFVSLRTTPESRIVADYERHDYFVIYWDDSFPRMCFQNDNSKKPGTCYDLRRVPRCDAHQHVKP